MQQVVFAAFVGAAIAFDQAAAQRNLVTQLPMALRAVYYALQPLVDHALLSRVAAAAHTQPFEAGQKAQRQHAKDGMRAYLERQRPGCFAIECAAAIPGNQPSRQCGW